jgi:hypothetical protein
MNHRLRETGKEIRDPAINAKGLRKRLCEARKALNTCFAFNELVEDAPKAEPTSLDFLFSRF